MWGALEQDTGCSGCNDLIIVPASALSLLHTFAEYYGLNDKTRVQCRSQPRSSAHPKRPFLFGYRHFPSVAGAAVLVGHTHTHTALLSRIRCNNLAINFNAHLSLPLREASGLSRANSLAGTFKGHRVRRREGVAHHSDC